ncbi:MAG: MGMT family protein [Pseudomonadota bacterium]
MKPELRAAIFDAVRRIPKGHVCAYGAVARLAGLPGRARLVGRALKETPEDTRLPWYRVVRSDRSLAFPVGTEAFERQRKLLAAEGVKLVRNRVPARAFEWTQDLDYALWGPPPDAQ